MAVHHKKWGDKDFYDGKPQSKTDMDDARAYFKGVGVGQMGGNGVTAPRGCAEFHGMKASWIAYSAASWRKLYQKLQKELRKSQSMVVELFDLPLCHFVILSFLNS